MAETKQLKYGENQVRPIAGKIPDNSVFDHIPHPLVIINPSGLIMQVSRSAVTLFHLSTANDAIGKTILTYIHDSDHQNAIDNLQKLLSGWNGPSRAYTLRKAGGENFTGKVSATVVCGVDGWGDYLILSIHELSEVTQKNDLLHLLSHELRQPVNAIIGFSELIGCNLQKNEMTDIGKLIQHNHIVTQQGIFLQNVIDQILSLTQVNDLQVFKTTFDINPVLGELFEVFNTRKVQLSKTNIDLQVIESPIGFQQQVYTDMVKLKQVFINILFNALKYTHEGSIRFGYHSHNTSTVTFFVSDTGIGIPVEKYNYVFNKYTRLNHDDAANESVGLGLSLTKQLITMLGGDIWFESGSGQGTTFYFTIPIK